MSSGRPSPQLLKRLLARWGFPLDERRIDLIWRYHGMLRAANEELNMTRIHNFEAMVLKHYVDCLLPDKLTKLPAPLLDMGTGPGLPGIILKIARPELPMILADTRAARCQFLEHVVAELGLKDIEIFSGKISPKFVQQMGGVITRAVADVPETLNRVRNCLGLGARLILMKGPDCDDEIAEARVRFGDEFALVEDHAYTLPDSTNHRRLLVYERIAVADRPEDADPDSETGRGEATRPIREIASTSNPNFQLCREIQQGRGIRKHGLALVSGRKMVEELLRDDPERIEAWITDRDGPAPPPGCPADASWLRMTKPLWDELDQFGSGFPILRVRTPEIPPIDLSVDPANLHGCTLLVPFQDPENVGAVLRSAAAFRADRVVLLREAAHPFHPKSLRSGGPAILRTPLFIGPSIRELPAMTAPLVVLGAGGTDIREFAWPESFVMLPGVEGPGLPANLPQATKLGIPIAEHVESLNANVATAIALFAWTGSRTRR
jgi:16S rRNA (guanine527-N7)-methyltransferase